MQPPLRRETLNKSTTVEEWAQSYILSKSIREKSDDGNIPPHFENQDGPGLSPEKAQALSLRAPSQPGRPPCLVVAEKRQRSLKFSGMEQKKNRAELLHRFWHHELQAAELMCWALLRFPSTPLEFRQGLLRIVRDEIRHMKLYEEHLRHLGYAPGDFEIRDWFWERVPSAQSPLQFIALVGMGLEAANLEHTERYATWFRAVGDQRGAELQEQVGREEVAHVRFATRWFRQWTGDVNFEQWCASLPPPLTPLLMKGKELSKERRLKAEMPPAFLQALETWKPDPRSLAPGGLSASTLAHDSNLCRSSSPIGNRSNF
ncbi:MAG: ferritin-like domain-containing protein [Polyangiaceae bacterium]|nr:ferritin-like domain-containing protein [Polyangiaceae bacterium]